MLPAVLTYVTAEVAFDDFDAESPKIPWKNAESMWKTYGKHVKHMWKTYGKQ